MLFRSLAGVLRSRTGTKVCLPVVRFNFDGQAKLWCVCLFSLQVRAFDCQTLIPLPVAADNSFLVSASGPGAAEVTKSKGERDRNGEIECDLIGVRPCWYVRFESHPHSPLTSEAPFSHFIHSLG